MTAGIPPLAHFRVEMHDHGLVHLVFDVPGRTMNVLSNSAIHELGEFGRWLARADVSGVLIRSGKDSFCAGADLGELGVAYDMIMAAPVSARFNVAFDHFFPLSAAIRSIETSGKPVAVAIGGLALGGGCELAMGAHYRVLADSPRAVLGLPESLVGLLPGAGGTQRLPRLVGLPAALPVLLDGVRLTGQAALDAGLVDALVPAGEEVAAAEAWLRSTPRTAQPWDQADWTPPSPPEVSAAVAPVRRRILEQTRGHCPAPLAILECVEFGLVQCFDGAIRTEMSIFSHLIQRPEPRDMIQTQFVGKSAYERLARKSDTAALTNIKSVVEAVRAVLAKSTAAAAALVAAGFSIQGHSDPPPVRQRAKPGYWIEEQGDDPRRAAARAVLCEISAAMAPWLDRLTVDERRMADYAAVRDAGFPAYLGGPLAFAGRERDRAEPGTGRSR